MKKYLVLDINKFAKELSRRLKPAVFADDKPICILTEDDIKDVLYKSHAADNIKVFETKIPRTGFASLDYLNGNKKPEEEDLDTLIDSHRGRRF